MTSRPAWRSYALRAAWRSMRRRRRSSWKAIPSAASRDASPAPLTPRRSSRGSIGRRSRPSRGANTARSWAFPGETMPSDSGSRVEGKPAAEIARLFPGGVRELGDGGPYHIMAGQPTDDSEMALTLARSILREKKYVGEKVLDGYRAW